MLEPFVALNAVSRRQERNARLGGRLSDAILPVIECPNRRFVMYKLTVSGVKQFVILCPNM